MNTLFLLLKLLVALLWVGACSAVLAGTPQQQLIALALLATLLVGHLLEGLLFRRVLQSGGPMGATGWLQLLLFGIVRIAQLHHNNQHPTNQ